MKKYPFDVSPETIAIDADRYVEAVFSCLESEFLVMLIIVLTTRS